MRPQPPPTWGLGVRWVLANLAGMAVAQIVLLSFVAYISAEGFRPLDNPVGTLLVLLLAALLIVGPQTLVMQGLMTRGRDWLLRSILAWMAGLALLLFLPWLLLAPGSPVPMLHRAREADIVSSAVLLLTAVLTGGVVGVVQGRLFGRRRHAWVVANTLALPLGLPGMLFFMGGLPYGIATGLILLRLLRSPSGLPGRRASLRGY